MVKIKENGESFATDYSRYSMCYYREIDEDEYHRLEQIKADKGYQGLDQEIAESLSEATRIGYGYAGVGIEKRGEKYYYYVTIYNSCD